MRMLMNVVIPAEPFNTLMRNGTVGHTIGRILETMQPETCYFTEHEGERGATIVVNVDKASQIPALAEPWYLAFEAECRFRIAMTPEDLQQSNLEGIAKNWE